MICEYYNQLKQENVIEVSLQDAFSRIERARLKARREMSKTDKQHVLFAITMYSPDGEIEKIRIFRNTSLTDDELDTYIRMHPSAYFDVLHSGTCKKVCEMLVRKEDSREIRPINIKAANAFINQHHRHHTGTTGCKFAIGLFEDNEMIGAAICGRPVSRYLDNGHICEVTRLCTVGGVNACSQLYSRCARIAKEMGYEKIITYILKSENGASLKASNFVCEGEAGGTHWTGSRNRGQAIPSEMKTRWSRNLTT